MAQPPTYWQKEAQDAHRFADSAYRRYLETGEEVEWAIKRQREVSLAGLTARNTYNDLTDVHARGQAIEDEIEAKRLLTKDQERIKSTGRFYP